MFCLRCFPTSFAPSAEHSMPGHTMQAKVLSCPDPNAGRCHRYRFQQYSRTTPYQPAPLPASSGCQVKALHSVLLLSLLHYIHCMRRILSYQFSHHDQNGEGIEVLYQSCIAIRLLLQKISQRASSAGLSPTTKVITADSPAIAEILATTPRRYQIFAFNNSPLRP